MSDRITNGVTSVLLVMCAVVALLLAPASASAKTVVVIYGKGGIQIWPPAVCPDQDPAKCAEVTIDEASSNPLEVTIVDAITGAPFRGTLAEPIPPSILEMQGSGLSIESLEPLE